MNTEKDELYTVIETALSFDSGELYDIEHLDKQVEVEDNYCRAAELYFCNDTDKGRDHMQLAYGAALELEDLVEDYKWGRAYEEVAEK